MKYRGLVAGRVRSALLLILAIVGVNVGTVAGETPDALLEARIHRAAAARAERYEAVTGGRRQFLVDLWAPRAEVLAGRADARYREVLGWGWWRKKPRRDRDDDGWYPVEGAADDAAGSMPPEGSGAPEAEPAPVPVPAAAAEDVLDVPPEDTPADETEAEREARIAALRNEFIDKRAAYFEARDNVENWREQGQRLLARAAELKPMIPEAREAVREQTKKVVAARVAVKEEYMSRSVTPMEQQREVYRELAIAQGELAEGIEAREAWEELQARQAAAKDEQELEPVILEGAPDDEDVGAAPAVPMVEPPTPEEIAAMRKRVADLKKKAAALPERPTLAEIEQKSETERELQEAITTLRALEDKVVAMERERAESGYKGRKYLRDADLLEPKLPELRQEYLTAKARLERYEPAPPVAPTPAEGAAEAAAVQERQRRTPRLIRWLRSLGNSGD